MWFFSYSLKKLSVTIRNKFQFATNYEKYQYTIPVALYSGAIARYWLKFRNAAEHGLFDDNQIYMTIRLSKIQNFLIGETLSIHIQSDQLHLFDATTEKRLAQ